MMHSQDWDMTQWVTNDPDKANAFILSEAGYDVWMGNNRGSAYSRGHLRHSKHDFEYWQFSNCRDKRSKAPPPPRAGPVGGT